MNIWLTIYLIMASFALGGIALFTLLGVMFTGKVSGKFLLEGTLVGLTWPVFVPFLVVFGLYEDIRRSWKNRK